MSPGRWLTFRRYTSLPLAECVIDEMCSKMLLPIYQATPCHVLQYLNIYTYIYIYTAGSTSNSLVFLVCVRVFVY